MDGFCEWVSPYFCAAVFLQNPMPETLEEKKTLKNYWKPYNTYMILIYFNWFYIVFGLRPWSPPATPRHLQPRRPASPPDFPRALVAAASPPCLSPRGPPGVVHVIHHLNTKGRSLMFFVTPLFLRRQMIHLQLAKTLDHIKMLSPHYLLWVEHAWAQRPFR